MLKISLPTGMEKYFYESDGHIFTLEYFMNIPDLADMAIYLIAHGLNERNRIVIVDSYYNFNTKDTYPELWFTLEMRMINPTT